MKYVFLSALCVIAGCEPSYRLYIKNSSDTNIGLTLMQVKVYGLFPLGESDTLYAAYANSERVQIHDIRWSTAKGLTQREEIERMNDSVFHIFLNKQSIYLISSGMLMPFNKMIVNQRSHADTLIMREKNRNLNNIKIHNKGFWRTAKIIEVF